VPCADQPQHREVVGDGGVRPGPRGQRPPVEGSGIQVPIGRAPGHDLLPESRPMTSRPHTDCACDTSMVQPAEHPFEVSLAQSVRGGRPDVGAERGSGARRRGGGGSGVTGTAGRRMAGHPKGQGWKAWAGRYGSGAGRPPRA